MNIRKVNDSHKARITAADEFDFEEYEDDNAMAERIDDVADNIEDLQDTLDEVVEDDVNIEIDNNIEDHYIAECDRCKGIFISAIVESDQDVEKVTGTCPLCGKNTDQYLKWIVKSI